MFEHTFEHADTRQHGPTRFSTPGYTGPTRAGRGEAPRPGPNRPCGPANVKEVSAMTTHTLPETPRPRVAQSTLGLLKAARDGLEEASRATAPGARYASAHLAALRGAAALLAARARPDARKRSRNVWELLPRVVPAMGEWAAFFAAGARKRAVAEAGLPWAVTSREADDLLRDAETFLTLVESNLGLASTQHDSGVRGLHGMPRVGV